MFQGVICTCEGRYYKINYRYERCKHTKACHDCCVLTAVSQQLIVLTKTFLV